MDNKDFDKLFSDKLSETQSFEYMDADWDNVAGRLSSPKKKKRRGGGWLWLFGLGFLFMAGTSIYLASTLNKTNKHLIELKTAVAELEKEQTEKVTIEKVDTIFKQVTILQYDTVKSTRESEQVLVGRSSIGNNSLLEAPDNIINSSTVPNERKTQKVKLENTFIAKTKKQNHIQELNNNIKAIETKTTAEVIPNNDKLLDIESLWMKSLSSSLLSSEMKWRPIDDFQEVPATVKVNKKKKLAWKYLSIGITGGSFLSRELSNRDNPNGSFDYDLLGDDFGSVELKNRFGWDIGVALQYQLGAKFSLTGAVHFQQNIYSGNEGATSALKAISEFASGDDFLLDNESTPNPNSEESINSYTFKQRMIAYQLGVNYTFRNGKKWRPYVGLSASATSMIKQTLYTDSTVIPSSGGNNGNVYAPESSRIKVAESTPINSSFRFTGIIPTVGFQLSINPKMSWQMEGWYRQGFNKEKDYLYGLLGVRTGVSYRF